MSFPNYHPRPWVIRQADEKAVVVEDAGRNIVLSIVFNNFDREDSGKHMYQKIDTIMAVVDLVNNQI
jgi:hypothetical protein